MFRFTTYLREAVENYTGKRLIPYEVVKKDVMALENSVREARLFANKVSKHFSVSNIA